MRQSERERALQQAAPVSQQHNAWTPPPDQYRARVRDAQLFFGGKTPARGLVKMLRLALFPIVAALFVLARGLAVTQSLPGPQATPLASPETIPVPEQTPPPELQTTWDWLTRMLPTSADQHNAEYQVNGCELTISIGTWSQSTSSDTSLWPNIFDWVYLVRFEPLSGHYFYDRPMSEDEARSFKQRHSTAAGQFKNGYVDVIDMSEASPSSFTVIGREKVPYLPFAGVQGRGQYAYFRFDDESHAYAVRRALLNAATLCGATEEPPPRYPSVQP